MPKVSLVGYQSWQMTSPKRSLDSGRETKNATIKAGTLAGPCRIVIGSEAP